jgi:hypothetical protein
VVIVGEVLRITKIMISCKLYTISTIRFRVIVLILFRTHQFVCHCYTNLYTGICITLFFVTRFDDDSSDKDVMLSELAVGVGKLTSHYTDNKDDKDTECIGKKSDENSGSVGVLSVVGGHVGQTNNPLRDNVNSNFVGVTSHLALNYNPPLGPFCEYFVIPIRIYELLRTDSQVSIPIRINEFVCLIPLL